MRILRFLLVFWDVNTVRHRNRRTIMVNGTVNKLCNDYVVLDCIDYFNDCSYPQN